VSSVGVIVAHHDARVAEQVAEVLEAAPDLFVAAASTSSALPGHVVVAGGEALVSLRTPDAPVIALAASDDAITSARAALAAGATDLILWPAEAERLAGAIRRASSGRTEPALRGRVVAVAGARGGLGVSSACAAIAATVGGEAIVVDLDAGAGQRAFCDDEQHRTTLDFTDPSPEEVEGALAGHPGGARCLHGTRGSEPSARGVHGVLRGLRALARVCVADVGRALSPGARAAYEHADVRVLLVGNDVPSVRGGVPLARDAHLVVRRLRRGGVALRDLRAALGGIEPLAIVPDDRGLARAVDLGTLPSRPTRGMRALARVARAVSG
jgi:Flp pilus assembly CpaE family ATPase